MLEEARQEAKELFEIATKIDGFKDFILGNNKDFNITELWDNGIEYNCGCTKHVFWLDDYCDYVFKIDIDNKYCEKEYEIYQKAKEAGISNLFAEIYYIGQIFGKNIYAMDYAYVSEDDIENDYYKKNYEFGLTDDEIEENLSELNSEDIVLSLFKFYYSVNIIEKLAKFISQNQLGDFHGENVGYIDNRLVFIDYSGY